MAAYATTAEIKASMPDVFPDSTHDTILETLAQRASDLIDGLLGWNQGAFDATGDASAKYYSGDGTDTVLIDPCVSITTVSVKATESASSYTDWTTDDWDKGAGLPENADWNAGYYTFLIVKPGISKTFTRSDRTPTVEVTAVWGRTATTPTPIKQAVIVQVGRWFGRGAQSAEVSRYWRNSGAWAVDIHTTP